MYRNYAVREKIPKVRGASRARTPYFRASLIQLHNSCYKGLLLPNLEHLRQLHRQV
jgi:hypothetical protein